MYNTNFNLFIMRRLFLFIVLLAFAANHATAQLNHVGIGYGPMEFPTLDGKTAHSGGAAYLSIGFEQDRVRSIGGTLIIAGNSRISYGNEQYGYGGVGAVGFAEMNITKNGFLRGGVFVGGMVFQLYEKVDLTQGQFIDPNPFPTQELKQTNFQPYGGVKLGVGPVEFQYAPASKMITVGFVLYKG